MRRLRPVLLVLLALLYVAGIPGSVVRPVIVEVGPAPAPVAEEVRERDGALDVVVRTEGGASIPRGRVRAYALLDGVAYLAAQAVTGEDGVAQLAGLPRAEHWVVAEADHRARASLMVVVVPGARRVDLALGPEHTLTVRVQTPSGEPVASAEIEVRGPDPFPVGARTDAHGQAEVTRLGAGPFSLVVRAPGYEEVTRRSVVEGAPLVVVLAKQGALLVHVADEAGKPAARARVLVASATLWPARVSETDEKGTVRLSGLDRGSYALRAVRGASVSPVEIGIAVERGEEREITLKLEPGASARVRVEDAATKEPVSQAMVTLAEEGLSSFPLEGVTGKDGRVTLGPYTRGAITVSARAEGFVARSGVRPESDRDEVEVGLVRGGTVVGRVRDARGYPIDGATVRVLGNDERGMPIDDDPQATSFRDAHFAATLTGPRPLVPAGELGVVPGPVPPIPHGAAPSGAALPSAIPRVVAEPWVSGRDGTFRATPVTPGRVRALVRHPQYVEALTETVALAPGGEVTLDVILLRGGSVEGKVVDTRGRGVAGARVFALATNGTLERTVSTASDGSFAFASLPREVTFQVTRDDDRAGATTRLQAEVPEGGRTRVEIVLPEAREPLPVTVRDARGRGIENAQVSAVSTSAGEAARVTAFSGRSGETTLAGVRGLPLRLEVHAPEHASRIVMVPADRSEVFVTLTPAESLTGSVWKNRREALAGAEIAVRDETGVHRARATDGGDFTVRGLSAGPARLSIRAKGRAPLERDIVVDTMEGRRPTALGRLELAEGGSIEGRVVDGRGDPVPHARVGLAPLPTYLPAGVAVPGLVLTDARGAFVLEDLAEGSHVLEALAPDGGRGRASGIRVASGRVTTNVALALTPGKAGSDEPLATGGVAVTLGEARPEATGPVEVVIVAVAEGSEAERAGILVGDTVVTVSGASVDTLEAARARLSGPLHDDVVLELRRSGQPVVLRVSRERVRR